MPIIQSRGAEALGHKTHDAPRRRLAHDRIQQRIPGHGRRRQHGTSAHVQLNLRRRDRRRRLHVERHFARRGPGILHGLLFELEDAAVRRGKLAELHAVCNCMSLNNFRHPLARLREFRVRRPEVVDLAHQLFLLGLFGDPGAQRKHHGRLSSFVGGLRFTRRHYRLRRWRRADELDGLRGASAVRARGQRRAVTPGVGLRRLGLEARRRGPGVRGRRRRRLGGLRDKPPSVRHGRRHGLLLYRRCLGRERHAAAPATFFFWRWWSDLRQWSHIRSLAEARRHVGHERPWIHSFYTSSKGAHLDRF
mmetsp:Transcript_7418/g.19400  ORF Transcript_7418/g.19400 Transcript_7418/m.19400 type:complete len:306 (+) Transcript_7418:972-1889(+)